MFPVIAFPTVDPVLIEVGPLVVRWYALAYIAGLVLGWRYMIWLTRFQPVPMPKAWIEDFFIWCALGTVLGGRIGYVLFYAPEYFLENPARIVMMWEGGMAFHGGLLGVALAMLLFARNRGMHPFALSDLVSSAVTIGLFFGRLANFINGELWGRVTDVPWAMVFPRGGDLPRHPSQLYEAFLEGFVLFTILLVCGTRLRFLEYRGMITGMFLLGYGLSRFSVEFVREPEITHFGWLTQGQTLSLPMMFAGLCFIAWALRKGRVPADQAEKEKKAMAARQETGQDSKA